MYDITQFVPDLKKYLGKGPADCSWPDETPITAITFTKPTSFDGEAMQVSIPVYKGDTLEDLKTRIYIFLMLGDERVTEKNTALLMAAEKEKAEKEEAEKKKKIEAQMESAMLVAAKKAAKRGDLAAVSQIAGGAIDQASNHSGSAQPS